MKSLSDILYELEQMAQTLKDNPRKVRNSRFMKKYYDKMFYLLDINEHEAYKKYLDIHTGAWLSSPTENRGIFYKPNFPMS